MKVALLLLAFSASLFAADQAVILDSPQTGTYTIPSSAPFTGATQVRMEMRLVGNGVTPNGCAGFAGTLWQIGGTLAFECLNPSQFGFFDNSISAGAVWNTPTQTDIILRMQWDGANALGNGAGCRSVDEWQTSNGQPIISPVLDCRGGGGTRSFAGLQGIGAGTNIGTMRVAWVRVYNTVIPTGGPTPRNGISSPANLMDWELDETGSIATAAETSGVCNCNITYSPNASSVAAPTYPPISTPRMLTGVASWMTNPVTVRSGKTWQFDASQSYGFCNPDILTYSWSQTAGPTTLSFSSSTAQQPTAQFGTGTGLGLGPFEYDVTLTVSDCNGSTPATIQIGAPPTDDNYVVQFSDPKASYMFIKLPMWGTMKWPQMDQDQKSLADTYSNQYPFAPNSPEWGNQAGTIIITPGTGSTPDTVTGTGTNFQTLFCGGTSTPDGSIMVIKTPSDGWKWGQIGSCNSATSISLGNLNGAGHWPFSACTVSGCTYGQVLAANIACYTGGSENCNYYDNVLAYYSLYYRSGLTAYLTAARALAAIWNQNPSLSRQFDGSTWPGNMSPPPRTIAFSGLAWWTYESGQPIWPQMRVLGVPEDITTSAPLFDIREQGYELKFQADLDVLDPNTGSEPWNSNLLASITNKWAPQQILSGSGTGSWAQYFFGDVSENDGAAAKVSLTLTNNSTTVSASVSSGTFNPVVGYMMTVPGTQNGFAVTSNYTGGSSGTFQITPAWPGSTQTIPPQPGHSSTQALYMNPLIAGVGNQPFIVGLDGNIWEHVYLATGDARAKQFTIDAANYLNNTGWRRSDNGMYYARVTDGCEAQPWAETAPDLCTLLAGASPNCTINPAPGCNNVAQQDRYLTGEASGAFTGAFLNSTGSTQSTILTMGNTLIGSAMGSGGGPFSDANYVRTNDTKHKTFGFWWGIGNAPSWDAVTRTASVTIPSGPVNSGRGVGSGKGIGSGALSWVKERVNKCFTILNQKVFGPITSAALL